ncbi:MAG: TetR/AcrR family transcriptional regulator [Pseudomonas marincola]
MANTKQTNSRKEDLQAYKRQRILAAATTLFREKGLEGATMRAIAKEADYSTGAPYAYFQSKEEIYAELLALSLGNLSSTVKEAAARSTSATVKARDAFLAYYQYYFDLPEDLQLGLYLFSSGEIRRRGFSDETNRLLNGKLIALTGYMANCLYDIEGVTPVIAQQETLDAISHITGILLLHAAGRIDTFGSNPQEMIDRYLTQMLERIRT